MVWLQRVWCVCVSVRVCVCLGVSVCESVCLYMGVLQITNNKVFGATYTTAPPPALAAASTAAWIAGKQSLLVVLAPYFVTSNSFPTGIAGVLRKNDVVAVIFAVGGTEPTASV